AGVRTTTWAGLDFILDEQPDLVISGINAGENIGPGGAVSSGTVSAAVTALLRGIPAIAISGGIDLTTFETPDTTYTAGAEYLVNLIAQLQATQGEDEFILPDGKGLSINIPSRFPDGVTEIQGVKFTNSSDTEPFNIDFGVVDEDGNVGLRFAPAEVPTEVNPTSEGDQFLSGFITVTPIDGNWTAPESAREAAEEILTAPEPVLAGDSDDPAIWVNPNNRSESIVIGTLKDGGLVTFNLKGEIQQTILPEEFGDIRYNNVDIIYNFPLASMMIGAESQVDLAIASDRENDTLTIFSISENGQLEKLSTPQLDNPEFSIFGVDDGEATAYGLASYVSPVSGKYYVFVTQADGNKVAQLELTSKLGPADEQLIEADVVRTLELPIPTGDAADSQSEGIVIDQELGFLYVALEDQVGILKFSAEPEGGSDFTVVQSVDADYLEPDIEGLSIYYGENGTGYLIANSQGDSSYAVFSREGNNEYLGNFIVGDNNGIDQVNESDGLDVINLPLGEEFPNGLLVLQDGANDPQNAVEDDEELENNSTNFKFVPWDGVANSFDNPLKIDTTSYDPRNPQPQSLINGIASGDTTQNSTVLWARSTFGGEVTFEYSTDAEFNSVIATVSANVDNINVPVKVEIENLTPGTQYYYRVTDAAGDSAIGEFKTSAEIGNYQGFRFGATGDWQQAPPYPSLKNADDRDLELFVKLGDTIYADLETPALPGVSQARTLDDFRTKQGEVLTTRFDLNTVPELYASTSILATIDDHEIVDNFAGGAAPGESPDAPDIGSSDEPIFTDDVEFVNDTQAYEDALQAYQEYHPIQDKFYGETGDSRTEGERKLYRYNNYGSDAAVIMLDSRSFRDAQIDPASLTDANDAGRFLAEAYDPSRTLLGRQQVEDLKADLLDAEEKGITWKFITIPEPIQNFGLLNAEDRFEGYAAERAEILQFIDDNDIDNVVFMAGDFHGTIVNNLTYQTAPGTEQIATNAFEIVTGPVAFNDGLFGPTVANLATAAGLINSEQKAFYDALPVAGDTDSELNDKDDFIKNLIVEQTTPLGYDPVGLNNNLAQAENLIDAELLQGDYVSTHTFGWTEFDIDAETQALTVTTYGIEPYSEAELLENPEAITSREPQIVSQFVVNPQPLDSTAPTVTGNTTPVDNASDVAIDENISFTLSEDVTAVAGKNITITDEDGNAIAIAADDTTQVSISGGTVTINPTADLLNGKEYTVTIETGAFTDAAGNVFDGTIAADGSFNFTTVDAVPEPITPIDTSNNDANGNEIELIDLAAYAGITVTASFEINREADFDNNVYFYTVDNANGEIGGIAPDASGYLQAALNNIINPTNGLTTADEQTTTGTLEIAGGDILGIAIVANGTLADANNNLDSVEGVYFSYIGANTDDGSFDHIKFEDNTFRFEDLANGGDQDFNDMEIKMEFTV
ncbi:MAG: phytase, partial [Cyanobacteria bacterium J06635_10]